MKAFVTGAAGFIGSTLVDRLLADGHDVVGYDNFSTGQASSSTGAGRIRRFTLVEATRSTSPALTAAMAGATTVFHLAANADVRFGTEHPRRDLEQNTIATFNVLEAMRAERRPPDRVLLHRLDLRRGDASFPTPEDAPFPVQTSLYGASKLAGEGLIQAYCEGFGFQGCIFRFVSILGERYTHGHVFDFYQRLLRRSRHGCACSATASSASRTSTCRTASTPSSSRSSRPADRVNIFNLGTDEYCQVNDSIGWICERSRRSRRCWSYTGGERGWIGDNPFIFLDTAKIRALGWRPELTIARGVVATLDYLQRTPGCSSAAGMNVASSGSGTSARSRPPAWPRRA